MSAYGWLKYVHVVSAIAAVGTNLTYFVWLRRIRKAPGEDTFVLEGLQELDRRLANPAYIALPVTVRRTTTTGAATMVFIALILYLMVLKPS